MKRLFIAFVISIVLMGCYLTLPSGVGQSVITPTPRIRNPAKQVTLNTLPLIERWRWQGIISLVEPAVAVTEDRIVIAEFKDTERKVVVLEADTGNPGWESEEIRSLKSLAADNNRVYVGTIRYVQAFDIETGRILWKGAEQHQDKKGSLVVYSKNEQVEVYDPYGDLLYILDPASGQTLEKILYPSLFFKRDNIYYAVVQGNHYLEAIDATSNQKLWSHDFEGYLYWPDFAGDTMLINAGGQIFGVEARTGRIIWRTTDSKFITGVALQDDIAYVLRYDAALVGFNPKTGQQVGVIEMTPNRTKEDDGGEVTTYTVATSDKWLVVYYGNSQELIVFEKRDN